MPHDAGSQGGAAGVRGAGVGAGQRVPDPSSRRSRFSCPLILVGSAFLSRFGSRIARLGGGQGRGGPAPAALEGARPPGGGRARQAPCFWAASPCGAPSGVFAARLGGAARLDPFGLGCGWHACLWAHAPVNDAVVRAPRPPVSLLLAVVERPSVFDWCRGGAGAGPGRGWAAPPAGCPRGAGPPGAAAPRSRPGLDPPALPRISRGPARRMRGPEFF